jgi:hypothetical protein
VVPLAGTFEYGKLQAFIAKNLSSDPVAREDAKVAVLNGTTTAGIALTESGRLTEAGYDVVSTDNAPTTDYKTTTIWQVNTKNTGGTAKALAKRYGVKVKTGSPGFTVASGTDIVIVIGQSSVSSRTNGG